MLLGEFLDRSFLVVCILLGIGAALVGLFVFLLLWLLS